MTQPFSQYDIFNIARRISPEYINDEEYYQKFQSMKEQLISSSNSFGSFWSFFFWYQKFDNEQSTEDFEKLDFWISKELQRLFPTSSDKLDYFLLTNDISNAQKIALQIDSTRLLSLLLVPSQRPSSIKSYPNFVKLDSQCGILNNEEDLWNLILGEKLSDTNLHWLIHFSAYVFRQAPKSMSMKNKFLTFLQHSELNATCVNDPLFLYFQFIAKCNTNNGQQFSNASKELLSQMQKISSDNFNILLFTTMEKQLDSKNLIKDIQKKAAEIYINSNWPTAAFIYAASGVTDKDFEEFIKNKIPASHPDKLDTLENNYLHLDWDDTHFISLFYKIKGENCENESKTFLRKVRDTEAELTSNFSKLKTQIKDIRQKKQDFNNQALKFAQDAISNYIQVALKNPENEIKNTITKIFEYVIVFCLKFGTGISPLREWLDDLQDYRHYLGKENDKFEILKAFWDALYINRQNHFYGDNLDKAEILPAPLKDQPAFDEERIQRIYELLKEFSMDIMPFYFKRMVAIQLIHLKESKNIVIENPEEYDFIPQAELKTIQAFQTMKI